MANLKYPLIEELPACNIFHIEKAYLFLDDWCDNLSTPITLDLFNDAFCMFSSFEAKVVLDSWCKANPDKKVW